MSRDVITVGSTMRILLLYQGEYSQWRESNKIAKDLCDALEWQMRGSEYGEQDRKDAILYEYETFKANEGEQLLDTYLRYLQYGTLMRQTKNLMDINIDALYNILKQNQGDVNDTLGYKKKAVVVTSDSLALVAEKTNVSKRKEKVVVSSDSEGSGTYDFSKLKKITALLEKAFNRRKFYSKPTNNNLRTSSTSQSANKKQEFVKTDDKKVEKKADEKKRNMSKDKCYKCKKEGQFAKDCKKTKVKDYNYYKIKMLLAKKDSDEQVLLAEDQDWIESSSDSDQEINANMVFIAQIEKVLSESKESSSYAEVAYYTFESESEYEFATSEYYDNSTNYGLFVNNNDDQEIFQDEIESSSENFIENHIDSQKDYDKSEVDHNDSEEKEHLVNKLIRKFNHKIAKCQKPKDLRPTLYDEKVIGLGYTPMFLTHSDEALEIEKFKRSRENKIKFAYDYGNLNASYVNEKIKFSDDYFQEIINPDFEKIDSPFQQTSSLKPYVPNVILEKIIIDLEDEVVSLLEKEKANLKTIESLKSKGFESSENAISKSKNQSENDCHVVEKECEKVENSKKKGSSNTSNVDLSSVSLSKLNKNVKRYSRKDLLSCNNSHLRDASSASVCNDAMNVSCNSRMCDVFDDNNFFIFDDESIVQICLWIIDSGCSKHMMGNRTLLTNFVEKFLGTVHFGNNDFVVIAGYVDVVIGSTTIKKVYYVEGLGHNLFSVG
nr:integrase, catalytic region, zinc finger, CCHC-type, peptidase aspartic, catalytic [Tanacetum cinerariifolium]